MLNVGSLNIIENVQSHKTLEFFERLKDDPDGWKICIDGLNSKDYETNYQIQFFCLQVLENYLKKSYDKANKNDTCIIKNQIFNWFSNSNNTNNLPTFLLNKEAQIVTLVFMNDFPSKWPNFFSDILKESKTEYAIDLYLRTLLAVHSEVVDRDIVRSQPQQLKCTKIKDSMRITTIPILVESWYTILTANEINSEIICKCLDVIGCFISWIDIDFIANDKFIPIILQCLGNELKRESACDCLKEIVCKGMPPESKLKLIDSLTTVLDNLGIFTNHPSGDDAIDFLAKLSKLLNCVGQEVLAVYQSFVKSGNSQGSDWAMKSLEDKIRKMFLFIAHEDDDVSGGVCSLAQEYISLLKTVNSQIQNNNLSTVETLLFACINRMKFDSDYDFNIEGEDEAIFQEYRKKLRNVVLNIGAYKPETILNATKKFFEQIFDDWRQKDDLDIELAMYLFYSLIECLPSEYGQQAFVPDINDATILQKMALIVIDSGVYMSTHLAVSLHYYECATRYDKVLAMHPDKIPIVLQAFIFGLQEERSQKVRSRVSYLLTRLIKQVNKAHLVPYVDELLIGLNDCLKTCRLCENDVLFIYEVCGLIIVQCVTPLDKKQQSLSTLLLPLLDRVNHCVEKALSENDDEAKRIYGNEAVHALLCIVRTSKGFTEKSNMKATKCQNVYTHVLQTVLMSLDRIPIGSNVKIIGNVYNAVRQLLHRMIVCLEDSVLPFVVPLLKKLIEGGDVRELQDVMALCSQLVTKFKGAVTDLITDALMPLTKAVWNRLELVSESTDDERRLLVKSHMNFILILANYGQFNEVIVRQNRQWLEVFLDYIINTALNSKLNNAPTQKICFGVLRKFIVAFNNENAIGIIKNLIRPCFEVALDENFNLNDAQTILALTEAGQCARTAIELQPELLTFLKEEYFPKLGANEVLIISMCAALQHPDLKVFKTAFRDFFIALKYQER